MPSSKISSALQTFMHELIDYAGLFPPAKLPLETAIANYAAYQQSADQWMLSRFIIPIPQLADLTGEQMAQFSADSPLRLSLLSSDIVLDISDLLDFQEQYADRITFDYLEMRLHIGGQLGAQIDDHALILSANGLHLRVFYELPFGEKWDANLMAAISAIAQYNADNNADVGFKLRCGGVEAWMFPSPEQVARAILLCREYGVPLKCTAGLHHPIRHYDESVATKMHGFVNVFGGALLAHEHQLDADALETIIADENPDNFIFTDAELSWKDLTVQADAMSDLRQHALISYGSCSFDEPREEIADFDKT